MLVIDAGLTNELFIKIYQTFSEIAALIGAGNQIPSDDRHGIGSQLTTICGT
jgi:hypothetical protein